MIKTKLISLLVPLTLIVAGCRTTKEATTSTGHSESRTQTEYHSGQLMDIIRDTLVQRDSIVHYIQGDTVRIQEYHTIYKSNPSFKICTDTLIKRDTVVVRDTLRQVKTVTKGSIGDNARSLLLSMLVGGLLVGILWIYTRFKK